MASSGGCSGSSASASPSNDAVGLGEYKLGMTIEEVRSISNITPLGDYLSFHDYTYFDERENIFIFLDNGTRVSVPTKTYASVTGGFWLYFIENKLVAIRKGLKEDETRPTMNTIKQKYSGKTLDKNTLGCRFVVIGKDGKRANYMLRARGTVEEVVIYAPFLYNMAIDINKSEKDAEKSKSVL